MKQVWVFQQVIISEDLYTTRIPVNERLDGVKAFTANGCYVS